MMLRQMVGWICSAAALAMVGNANAALTSTNAPVRALFEQAASDPDAKRLGAARVALEAGDPGSALHHLGTEAPKKTTALTPLWILTRAESLARTGRVGEALALLEKVKKPARKCGTDLLYTHLVRLHAELIANRSPAAAADLLLTLPADGGDLTMAETLYKEAKKKERAEDMRVRLLVEVPDATEARMLAEELIKKKALVNQLKTKANRIARIRKLVAVHLNEDANLEAAALLAEEPSALSAKERCELLYLLGKTQRKMRSYKPAVKTLTKARAFCSKVEAEREGAERLADFAVRSALLETRVRGIRRQIKGTKRSSDWILKNHPGHRFADDALAMHAHVLERKGRMKAARQVYARILSELPDGDHAPKAAWRLALAAIEQKKDPKKLLQKVLAADVKRPIDHSRARYWLARALETDEEKSKEAYREVVLEPSFYAWLALDRLERTKPKWAKALKEELLALRKTHAPLQPAARTVVSTEAHRLARLFAAASSPLFAESALSELSCRKWNDQEIVTLAESFEVIGAYPAAQLLLRKRKKTLLARPLDRERLPIWYAAYSRPYWREINDAAKKGKVEPLLLLALSREESTFDPEIVSWAGATGLAQLMPATAIGAYADVFGGRLNLTRLTEPELNLRLGAHVLRQGMRRFKMEPLALAAYNGGHGLVNRQLPKEKGVPFDRWVERISVQQTRRYVKRVVETWGIYRFLYDETRPFVSLPDTIKPRK